ncbi:MAG: c-type cytochrome [Desulfatiglandales bacterium]
MVLIYPIVGILGIFTILIAVFKRSPFFKFIGLLLVIYGGLKSVEFFAPPLPNQVVMMFMAMSVFALLVYFSIQEDTLKAFLEPIRATLADDKKIPRIAIVYILIPALAGLITYQKVKPQFNPPISARIIHPEPPFEIEFRGKKIKILGLENPLRKDAANLSKGIDEGKKIYFQNCFFCHGNDLNGQGHFAKAFNPVPQPFRGTDTIAMLPESFVFWRTAKGWKGLPMGSTPWDSSMPAFEDFLTEDEIWKVILYIYDASGNKPRTW